MRLFKMKTKEFVTLAFSQLKDENITVMYIAHACKFLPMWKEGVLIGSSISLLADRSLQIEAKKISIHYIRHTQKGTPGDSMLPLLAV